MNYQHHYQNTIQFGSQTASGMRLRQTLTRKRLAELPGGVSLWIAVAKVSCLLLCAVLACSLWLRAEASRSHLELQEIQARHHLLRAELKTLRETKALLFSMEQVGQQAGAELALYLPGDDQVYNIR